MELSYFHKAVASRGCIVLTALSLLLETFRTFTFLFFYSGSHCKSSVRKILYLFINLTVSEADAKAKIYLSLLRLLWSAIPTNLTMLLNNSALATSKSVSYKDNLNKISSID